MENINLTNLLLIDNRVNDIQLIINSIELSETKYLIINYESDTLESIKENINSLGLTNMSNVGIFQENYNNSSYQFVKSFGNSVLVNVETVDSELSSWSQYVSLLQHLKTLGMSNLDLMACNINSDPNWNYVINKLKSDLSIDIESSVDNTGNSELGGNWILESNNSNMINKYFNSQIYNYEFVLGSSSVTNTTPILLNNGTALIQNGSESIYFKDENGNNLTNIISVVGGGPAIPTGFEGSANITKFGESFTYINSNNLPVYNWNSLAVSLNGQYITVGSLNRSLFVSNDYGLSWTEIDIRYQHRGAAMSSNGKYQIFVKTESPCTLYLSINYGSTWTAKLQSDSLYGLSVDVSSTGQYMSAVFRDSNIYTSSDYGSTWISRDSARNWTKISMSSDGQIQMAAVFNSYIYKSTDYGVTWTALTNNIKNWKNIKISSTGQYCLASHASGLMLSNDYGATWSNISIFDNTVMTESIISTDNKYQVVIQETGGRIWVSTDFGVTWNIKGQTGRAWTKLAWFSKGFIVTGTNTNLCFSFSSNINLAGTYYALTNNGYVYAMGSNCGYGDITENTGAGYSIGLLGQGSLVPYTYSSNGLKIKIDGSTYVTNAIQVEATGNSFAILLSNGKVLVGGSNANGRSGQNTVVGSLWFPAYVKNTGSPVLIDNVKKISIGKDWLLMLKNDGTVWGCGNDVNKINAASGNKLVATQVKKSDGTFITGAYDIACGDNHELILAGGILYAGGSNTYGQLGNGTTTDSLPTRMKINSTTNIGNNIFGIAAGIESSAVLVKSMPGNSNASPAGIYSCGRNLKGELGTGNTTQQTYLTMMKSNASTNLAVDNVKMIEQYPNRTGILYNDGSVKMVGDFTGIPGYSSNQTYPVDYTVSGTPITNVNSISSRSVISFSVSDLIASGFNVTDLKGMNYTATQLKDAGITLSQLSGAGFTANELKNANYSITDLKNIKNGSNVNYFTTQQVIQAGFDASTLKNLGGYSASDLKQYGSFTISQLADVSYTASELKDANYSVTELKNIKNSSNVNYFTTQQVIQAGFDASTLKNLGEYSASQLKQYGSYTLNQLIDATYTINQLKDANYSVAELKNIKNSSDINYFTPQQVIQAGFDATALKNDGEYSASQLKEFGSYNIIDLIGAGYSTSNLKDAQYSVSDLKNAKDTNNNYLLTPQQVIQAGFDALTLKNEGNYSASQLKQFGSFTFSDFVLANYNATDLRNADYPIINLIQANFKYDSILKAGYSVSDLKINNFTLVQMKNANYTFRQLSENTLYSVPELKSVGYKAIDLKNASYEVTEIINNGYTMKNIKAAQFTVQELRSKNINPLTLLGSYTLREIKQGGYTIQEMSSATLDSVQFTGTQLKNAGYSALELKSVGYDLNQLLLLKYTPKNLKDAGYNANELSSVGISNRVLRYIGL